MDALLWKLGVTVKSSDWEELRGSDATKVGIDQLTNSKVLGADEALHSNLLCCLVLVDINFVHVVESLVEQQCLDVVLLSKELLKFDKLVLFGHQKEAFPLKLVFLYDVFAHLLLYGG